jgi:gamma-glutamyl-gamma-aminobutyrate hydrolase PuuD
MDRKRKTIDWVSEIHLSLLLQEELFPMIVPLSPEVLDVLPEYLDEASGLMLGEGGDIDPMFTGIATSTGELDEVDLLKDRIEFALLEEISGRKLPFLGICRGNEMLNVSRGGTLHLDVYHELGEEIVHLDPNNYDDHRHGVTVLRDTPLFDWYGEERLMVNSYHHQGIKRLGNWLQPMALADDGLVEAVFDPSAAFCVGLQFHPERMLSDYAANRRVFAQFGDAVRGAGR